MPHENHHQGQGPRPTAPHTRAPTPAKAEVVVGDLTMPESLDPALEGAGAVFLVWTAPPETAEAVVERLASHVRRVVFLSSPHRTPHPFFQQPNPVAVLHADIERLIAATGLEPTLIRPGMLASNAAGWWAPAIRAGEPVRWPHGAAESAPVDDRDVAAVAARILGQDGHAVGDYVLTGPESLTQAAQVKVIGDVLGRRIAFEETTPEEFRRRWESAAPRSAADMLLSAWNAAVGQPAYVTSAVADILGTAPRTFRRWAADHAAAFTERP
ncbi:NAD(P)H-binding protein [Streptomyces sp. BBFR102]|uniref:NAD(P)H-binding protein n=1 Tax=Streptomyces sp. BBFR102 TaxID=3448171 RepID=UPI003F52BBB5